MTLGSIQVLHLFCQAQLQLQLQLELSGYILKIPSHQPNHPPTHPPTGEVRNDLWNEAYNSQLQKNFNLSLFCINFVLVHPPTRLVVIS